MAVRTTSTEMFLALHGRTCRRDHEHRAIAGTVHVKGDRMSCSAYTERYTRKFSRYVAKNLIKIKQHMCVPVLVSHDDSRPDRSDAPCKRLRINSPSSSNPKSRMPPTPLEVLSGHLKRRRIDGKTTEGELAQSRKTELERLITVIKPRIPRVGKTEIKDPDLINQFQKIFPEKIIRRIMVCKGSDRTLAPPKDIVKNEAPYRIAAIVSRTDESVRVETDWEFWQELSNRQVVRPSHPARINITLFASNREPGKEGDQTESTRAERTVTGEDLPKPQHEVEDKTSGPTPSRVSANTPSQKIDLQSATHGSRFMCLSPEEKTFLIKLHQNLGHPSHARLSQVLREQGHEPSLSQGILDMKCSTCQNEQRPKIQRPATIKDDLDFNDKVGIDGIKYTAASGTPYHFYHMIDYGTNYHVACSSPGQSSQDAIEKVVTGWFQWAGAPLELHTDAGTEFTSREFANMLTQFNIKAVVAAPGAHWQIGKVERHGEILQTMLRKYEHDFPIKSYQDLQTALAHCTSAKNALSLRHGYSPDILTFGKTVRVPASVTSDYNLPSHLLADEETQEGILFRNKLARREAARKAFHMTDNDMSLRRAILRRTRPDRGMYHPGTWVMMWRQTPTTQGWFGPARVIQQEGQHCVWCNHMGNLIKISPEHIREISEQEKEQIPQKLHPIQDLELEQEPTRGTRRQTIIETIEVPEVPNNAQESGQSQGSIVRPPSSTPEEQPDQEPSEGPASGSPDDASEQAAEIDPANVPIPTDSGDELVCDHLLCVEGHDENSTDPDGHVGWKYEAAVTEQDIKAWKESEHPSEYLLVATSAKRDRTEVKLHQLSQEEQELFRQAKNKEIQNWLDTGTVSRIFRHQLSPQQILRCRWICIWKPLDEENAQTTEVNQKPNQKTHKPKARLVVLGYQDPQLETIPRDSPTLGKQSKMLLLQLVSSMGWTLRSFDIRAAFLQGKTQEGRTLAIEPVPELKTALNLKENQVCKLEKSAYGLIDAPFLWYKELDRTLRELNFVPAPFDPCAYILYQKDQQLPSGILGVHVDDGLCGGDQFFDQQIAKLEAKFPFGSKKTGQFTFTGVDIDQNPDKSIVMSQGKYISKIEPIHMSANRRTCLTEPVTSEEKHGLRALIGSLQYAAINTRPDLSSRLSYLQSEINKATVQTLHDANRVLHEAKRYKDTHIRIQPIPIKDLRFLMFSDASFASAKSPESHTGMIILATHKDIMENYQCPVSPLSWGCKKIQKVVTSTLSAETTSLQTSLDQLSWLRLYWTWLLDPKTNWRQPQKVFQNIPPPVSSTTHLAQMLPKAVAVTDCKSLYDLVTRTAQPNCQEFRTQLQARAIKDLLSEGVTLRWVHTGAQLADSLTKVMQNHFLRYTLQQGRYQLNDELQVLKQRADHRTRVQWLSSGCPADMKPTKSFEDFLGV